MLVVAEYYIGTRWDNLWLFISSSTLGPTWIHTLDIAHGSRHYLFLDIRSIRQIDIPWEFSL